MNFTFTLIELEGLEYLLARIIGAYERAAEIPEDQRTNVREITQFEADRIRIEDGHHDVYLLYNFALEEIFIQDKYCLARGYRVTKDISDIYKETPILIDLTEFLFDYSVNLNRLEEKIYRATGTIAGGVSPYEGT